MSSKNEAILKWGPFRMPDRPWLRFPRALSPIWIIALYLSVRAIYLWELSDQPLFTMLMGDAQSYDHWASTIAGGDWLGREVFFQSPLYPYFLASVYSLGGRNFLIVRLVQIAMGALACWFVIRAGASFFSRRAGILAGLLLALYPPAIFYDLQIQKTAIDLFCMAALLSLCGGMIDSVRWRSCFGMGIVLGLFGLNRENALLLIPCMLFWLWVHFRPHPPGRLFRLASGLLGGAALVLLPVGIRNQWVGGEFLLTTSQFGYNFFIGNSKDATGSYRPLTWDHGDWRYERQDAVQLAEKEAGRTLTPSEVSRYWLNRALSDIRSNPSSWARLILKKAQLFGNAIELSDTESEYAHRQWSLVLRLLGGLFHFGILLPLAAAGAFAARGRLHRQWVLHLILGVYAFSILLFYIFSRYRFPIVPVLVLWAAFGSLQVIESCRERRLIPILVLAGVAAATGIFSNWGVLPIAPMIADTHYNIGCGLEEEGRTLQAVASYQRTLEYNPSHIMAMNNLGYVHQRQGDYPEALRWYESALRINGGIEKLHTNLGMVYGAVGRHSKAIEHYHAAIRINPDLNPAVYFNLACMLARQGEGRQSLLWLGRAVSKGFSKKAAIAEDPDLESIRNTADYRAILESIP